MPLSGGTEAVLSIDPVTAAIAILISVRDVERSSEFYKDILGLPEVLRDPTVIVLGDSTPDSPTLFLRQGPAHAVHAGFDTLGVRSLMFSLPSVAELDRVEARLRAWDGFRERHAAEAIHAVEVLTGHDPDRNALAFLAAAAGGPVTVANVDRVPPIVYGIDL